MTHNIIVKKMCGFENPSERGRKMILSEKETTVIKRLTDTGDSAAWKNTRDTVNLPKIRCSLTCSQICMEKSRSI